MTNLIRVALVILCFGLITYCARQPSTPDDPNSEPSKFEFRELVKYQLKDANSAEFRNEAVYPVPNRDGVFIMCGEVNAKNSYGAYTGFKRFIVGFGGEHGTVLMDDRSGVFDGIWWDQCRHSTNTNTKSK